MNLMKSNKSYFKEMITIGLPITLQSIFQASYSLIDQLMVGRLGTVSIASGGLGGKFSGLVSFTIASVVAVASILIAQYHGKHDREGINKSFFTCSYIALIVMCIFALPAMIIPNKIMHIYTSDAATITIAANYLSIISISFIPMTITMLLSSLLRSTEQSRYPMYASIISMVSNVGINYILIFGFYKIPAMGLYGAGLGTLISRLIEMCILLFCTTYLINKEKLYLRPVFLNDSAFLKRISIIILPILLNEFLWSVGENIYAVIYGHLGTNALAAMTLTNPLQSLFIGMFSGISSASIVMVGKRLGNDNQDEAYSISKYLMRFGIIGAVIISVLLASLVGLYVRLFNVEPEVARLTRYIVYALSFVLFAKIGNMILSGGIIRSGGNTKISLIIDLIGTWLIGVPLGIITGLVLELPIYVVYFVLSLEEVVRYAIGIWVFRRKKWMCNVTTESTREELV